MEFPQPLVHNGCLVDHIYRIATLCEREKTLIRGRGAEDFPDLALNNSEDLSGGGFLPSCEKSLATGEILGSDQFDSLTSWHCGLPCQVAVTLKEGILFSAEDDGFLEEFRTTQRRSVVEENDGSKHRILFVYELKRGTLIPSNVGIEQDGENHVTLFPNLGQNSVSDISPGQGSFTIDALVPLQSSWRPFAVLKIQGDFFPWPECFPADTPLFRFRSWLSRAILHEDASAAYYASSTASEYTSGACSLERFLGKMMTVCDSSISDPDYEFFCSTCSIKTALRFALNCNTLRAEGRRCGYIFCTRAFLLYNIILRLKSFLLLYRLSVYSVGSFVVQCHQPSKHVTNSAALDAACRAHLSLQGGSCHVTATATSVCLFYSEVEAMTAQAVVLPFVVPGEAGCELLFDKLEPCDAYGARLQTL